jgi:sulfite reductase alpha subunit-like flavoprotein
MITGINGYGANQYEYSVKDNAAKVQKPAAEDTKAASVKEASQAADEAKTAAALAEDKESANIQKAPVKTDSRSVMNAFRGGKELNIFSSTSRFNEISDADEAVKSMKKDDVLDRYTYFVNPVASGLGTDEDGTVRLKTNNQ